MNNIGGQGISLWDEEDEFFYDVLHRRGGRAAAAQDPFDGRADPLVRGDHHRPATAAKPCPTSNATCNGSSITGPIWPAWYRAGKSRAWANAGCLAILRGHRMKRVLHRMLDENEFLSPHGVRSVSRYHAQHPYVLQVGGTSYTVTYQPAESDSDLFGGNSNWRGPVWFPVNYLIIEALRTFHRYYGDDFKVECPTGSGQYLTLEQIADDLAGRLIRIFLRDGDGRRPVFGGQEIFQNDPHWRDHILFHEYFHGDNGAGIGASHQTGWTGLVADLIQQAGEGRAVQHRAVETAAPAA